MRWVISLSPQRVLTLEQHDTVVGLAEKWHVRLGDAILSKNWADPAVYYKAVAQHFELPLVDLIKRRSRPVAAGRCRRRYLCAQACRSRGSGKTGAS